MKGWHGKRSAPRRKSILLLLLLVPLVIAASRLTAQPERPNTAPSQPADARDRSPVDLVLTPDEQWLLTANQTADSVSLIKVATGEVAAEAPCGRRPSAPRAR